MIRCRIRLTFPAGLPRVKVTGTFPSTFAAFDLARSMYPTAASVAVCNLGPVQMSGLHEHEHGRQVDTQRDETTPAGPRRLEPNFRPDFGIEHHRAARWFDPLLSPRRWAYSLAAGFALVGAWKFFA